MHWSLINPMHCLQTHALVINKPMLWSLTNSFSPLGFIPQTGSSMELSPGHSQPGEMLKHRITPGLRLDPDGEGLWGQLRSRLAHVPYFPDFPGFCRFSPIFPDSPHFPGFPQLAELCPVSGTLCRCTQLPPRMGGFLSPASPALPRNDPAGTNRAEHPWGCQQSLASPISIPARVPLQQQRIMTRYCVQLGHNTLKCQRQKAPL